MLFFRSLFKTKPTWLRRFSAGLLVVAFWALLAGLIQPAAAGPLPQGITTGTSTGTATASATATATTTVTASALLPAAGPIKGMVIINEVGWMGTWANSGSEWIELYNPGNTDIVLDGWELSAAPNPFKVVLKGTIKKKQFFVLGRILTDTDPGPFREPIVNQPFMIGSPTEDVLPNAGVTLRLKHKNGFEVDTANNQGGAWPAGTAGSRLSQIPACSMERTSTESPETPGMWVTNDGKHIVNGTDQLGFSICGTPGKKNWAFGKSPTPTITPTPTRTVQATYCYYCTRTITPTPKKSLTPTRNPNATPVSIVVINEFLPQPRSDWNGDGQVNTGDEFIEIINLGIQSVSLANWSLDDQPGDSSPFTIGNVSIEPGGRLAFFNSETGILLSTGGDSVRLFRAGGQISDAFTYSVIRNPDQSWCRLPDGKNNWVFGCAPTVMESNRMAQSIILGNRVESGICLSKSMPLGVLLAECDSVGLSAWDSALWDALPTYPLFFDAGRDVYILE